MRKITVESINAFMNDQPFSKSNTAVEVLPNVTILVLHGYRIAYRYNDPERTLMIRNAGWQTNVTKERLNGLPGVSIHQKNFEWYLNDEKWDGSRTDVYSDGSWAYSYHRQHREANHKSPFGMFS